jgi:hypothetical protein
MGVSALPRLASSGRRCSRSPIASRPIAGAIARTCRRVRCWTCCCDESNPRSVAFQLVLLQEVARLQEKPAPHQPRGTVDAGGNHRAAPADADELARIAGGQAVREGLGSSARLSSLLEAFSDAISLTYFTHTEVPQQLVRVP